MVIRLTFVSFWPNIWPNPFWEKDNTQWQELGVDQTKNKMRLPAVEQPITLKKDKQSQISQAWLELSL